MIKKNSNYNPKKDLSLLRSTSKPTGKDIRSRKSDIKKYRKL
jgi:hypothetical protein